MMSCAQVAAIVRDHDHGKLPGRARLGVRLHLMMCGACRRYLRQLRAAMRLTQAAAAPAEAPPAAVEDAALAAFRARRDPP